MSQAPSEEPPPARIRFQSAGVELSALDYGPRDGRGPSMVMLHGIRDHAWSLDAIARPLRQRYRIVVPDLRGHGRSAKPGSYAMAELVSDLHALITQLELERPVLIGHSLGGQVATWHAGLFPEASSALLNLEGLGAPRRPDAQEDEQRRLARTRSQIQELASGAAPPGTLPGLDAAIERFQTRNPRVAPERARLLVEQGTEPAPDGGVRWRWDPAAGKVWLSFSPLETEAHARRVRCPVLVVTAANSAAYWSRSFGPVLSPADASADLARKLALFSRAEHLEIEDAGHMIHYDQPDAVVAGIVRFLARHEETAPTSSA